MEQNTIFLITTKIKQLSGEEWRPIPNCQGRYWISNKGRVCSTIKSPKLMGQYLNNYGYYRVAISPEKNNSKRYLVHRLVAEAFLINDCPEEKTTVHHKNHNKKDNTVENLEYLSLSDNIKESEEYFKAMRLSNGEK